MIGLELGKITVFDKCISHHQLRILFNQNPFDFFRPYYRRFGEDEVKIAASKTMKILVAHRQKKTVDLIKSVLSSSNPVVLHTESGLDGLLTSRIEYFDVIICSTDLPVVTGFELVRSIRTNSINRQTPVILLAEEMNEKTYHLSNALNVNALLSMSDIVFNLAHVVGEHVKMKVEERRPWQELVPVTRPVHR